MVALWGDHGYALGDNDEWAKQVRKMPRWPMHSLNFIMHRGQLASPNTPFSRQTNFEHATRIPFMIHVPGLT